MPRGLDTTVIDALSQRKIITCDLLELHLDPAVYFTNGAYDITYDSPTAPDAGSNLYVAQGQFISFGDIQETADVKVNAIDISFTAVDLTTLGYVLNNDYIDKRVVLHKVLFEIDGSFNSMKVFQYFDGRINEYLIQESEETVFLKLNCASQFADFEKIGGRQTSVASQQLHYPGDLGMQYSNLVARDIKWGRS